jgi:hypothetical protein
MAYLFLGRIDSRGGDNRLMQILKIDQSINCCCKIRQSFQDRFLEVDQGSLDSLEFPGSGFLGAPALPGWECPRYQSTNKEGAIKPKYICTKDHF